VNESPKLHPNFFIGSLHLLYWVFFKTFILHLYTDSIVSEVTYRVNKISLKRRGEWRRVLVATKSLWKFLAQSFLITFVTPVFFVSFLGIIGIEVSWAGVGVGLAMGFIIGSVSCLMVSISANLSIGVSIGVMLEMLLGVVLGTILGVSDIIGF
jgi:hypothetical protein